MNKIKKIATLSAFFFSFIFVLPVVLVGVFFKKDSTEYSDYSVQADVAGVSGDIWGGSGNACDTGASDCCNAS